MPNLDGIVVIVGNYGSGKTEVAINLALWKKSEGANVSLADLDLVNPYFRAREAIDALSSRGIKVVIPPRRYFYADLPILDPAVAGAIKKNDGVLILDAGGDDVGATVLAALGDFLKNRKAETLMTLNPMRPMTSSVERSIRIMREIEASSKLKITGFIGNANLMEETSIDDIYEGYGFIKALSAETGLPITFVTAESRFMPEIEAKLFSCPVMPLNRRLVPPWKKPSDA